MIKDPRHALNPAFAAASDWKAYQLTHLSPKQRAKYDDIKKLNDQKLTRMQSRVEKINQELQTETLKRLKFDRNFTPPTLRQNTHMLRLGTILKLERQKYADLRRSLIKTEINYLKDLEHMRPAIQPQEKKPLPVLKRPLERAKSPHSLKLERPAQPSHDAATRSTDTKTQMFRQNATEATRDRLERPIRPHTAHQPTVIRRSPDKARGTQHQQKQQDRDDPER